MDEILLGLSLVVVLSVAARLLGTWLSVPAIVPLLAAGVLAGGSVTGLVEPDELLGDALSPLVEIAVAVILFEGALNLRREELGNGVRPTVLRLLLLGSLITWIVGAAAVDLLFDVPLPIAVLIGAVLIVSGPTVVMPMLEFIRPSPRVASILKWEGVLVDPLGAIVAVLVFTALVGQKGVAAFGPAQISISIGVGLAVGLLGGLLLMPLIGTRRLSGRDKVAATLMMVVAAFAAANGIRDNSGLAAAIAMGLLLANQSRVDVDQIVEFKETLVPILIGVLFVLLAAQVDVGAVIDLGWPGLALLAVLILAARPLAVATTAGLPVSMKERGLMALMAPRGIVAASTASVFGLELTSRNVPGAEMIIPITFLVIAGTVVFYSLSAPAAATAWGLAGATPPKLLFVGGPAWAVRLGREMIAAGVGVTVWTRDPAEARTAAAAGLEVSDGPLVEEGSTADSPLADVTAVALVTGDDTLNQVLAGRFGQWLEADQIYRLRSASGRPPILFNRSQALFSSRREGEEMIAAIESGGDWIRLAGDEALPPGAVRVASIRFGSGSRPDEIRLATLEGSPLKRRSDLVLALAPSGTRSPVAAAGSGTAAGSERVAGQEPAADPGDGAQGTISPR